MRPMAARSFDSPSTALGVAQDDSDIVTYIIISPGKKRNHFVDS